jgi:hypothetical protein
MLILVCPETCRGLQLLHTSVPQKIILDKKKRKNLG